MTESLPSQPTITPNNPMPTAENSPKRELGTPNDQGFIRDVVADADRPLSLLELPHIIDLVGVKIEYEIDSGDVQEYVRSIDIWIRGEILKRGLQETISSYERIVKEINNKLDITDDDRSQTKLDKMYLYLKHQIDAHELMELVKRFS